MHCSILCNQMVKTLINTVPKVWVLVNFLPDHWCKIETDLDTWGSYSNQVHSGHSEGTWSSPYTDTGPSSCYRSPPTFPTSHSHTLEHTMYLHWYYSLYWFILLVISSYHLTLLSNYSLCALYESLIVISNKSNSYFIFKFAITDIGVQYLYITTCI